MPRDSGESIFAARHQDVSQGPQGTEVAKIITTEKLFIMNYLGAGVIYYPGSFFTPRLFVLELIMRRGNSAACYVEKPRLGASGGKMTPENLIEINFQRGNLKLSHKIVFSINWVAIYP